MFESLERSWRLAKESLGVLRKDPELMIFPIISFIAGVLVAGVVAGIAFGTGTVNMDSGVSGPAVLLIALFYLGTFFVTIYFQVALVASVKLRLSGGNPTLGYGIQESNKRLGAIFTWAVIAAIVGLLLRLLENVARRNTQGLGRVVAEVMIGMLGMAWSLVTFFVIPIIAYEGVGGFAALKRSGSIIKNRWGEAVVGGTGIGLVTMILAIAVGALFGGIGLLILSSGGTVALVIGLAFIAIAVMGVLFIIALSSTLQSIYVAVLYEYATAGKAGNELFSPSLVSNAFVPDRSREQFA